jgi:hypothetical protein
MSLISAIVRPVSASSAISFCWQRMMSAAGDQWLQRICLAFGQRVAPAFVDFVARELAQEVGAACAHHERRAA